MGDSVNRQRIHHQLSPNELNWQDDVLDGPEWLEMIKTLGTIIIEKFYEFVFFVLMIE